MGVHKNYDEDDLLRETDEFLKKLEGPFDEELMKEIETAKMKSLERVLGLRSNGFAELFISEDEMSCCANFNPPTRGGEEIQFADIEAMALEWGIYPRVNWDAVKDAVETCNTERRQINDLLIAEGIPPADEIPRRTVIEEKLKKHPRRPDPDAKKIDYKEFNPFILVKKGDILAHIYPELKGVSGISVTGNEIPYRKRQICGPLPGKNTEIKGDTVIAAEDGSFEENEQTFHINQVMEIQGNVNYSTGHINFPGDIIINGIVEDGFKVYSGGSIYCRKTLDASDIKCEKDLIVAQGIIGKQTGRVKVKGKITAKFIENCYVEAGDDIEVTVGILNSIVSTSGWIRMGKKGMIVGGRIYAQHGVRARQIGTASETRTEIFCGIDYIVLQKIEWIRDKNIELSHKLKKTEEAIKKAEKGAERLISVKARIKDSIHKLNEAAKMLIVNLDKNEDADINVQKVLYPGTYIEICHISYITTREMRNVTLRLNKEKGRIDCEKLR